MTAQLDTTIFDWTTYPGATEESFDRVVAYMRTRAVPMTRENIRHALDGEDLKDALRECGVDFEDDGRISQVSPTSNMKGKVVLTFDQAWKLVEMIPEPEDVQLGTDQAST